MAGIFKEGEDIELTKRQLQVCIGPFKVSAFWVQTFESWMMRSNISCPLKRRRRKGQFFTPRHVVEMCVRMLNPKRTEYVMDPACGSGGFLLHAMDWCYPAKDTRQESCGNISMRQILLGDRFRNVPPEPPGR